MAGDDAGRLIRTRGGRVACLITSAILAVLTGTLAMGAVSRERAPEAALALIPTDGFAPANAAVRMLRATLAADPSGPVNAAVLIPLAERSRRAEPLWSRPLALLATVAERRGDTAYSRRLMQTALALSRRDAMVNAWFIADAGRRGDLGAMVAGVGRSILTEPSTATTYLPSLAGALADPSTVPVFAEILRRRPAWDELFWREAGVNVAALRNAGELRAQLHRTLPSDMAMNRSILAMVAGADHLDTAERLYRSYLPPAPPNAPLVHDERFRARLALPPFDWEEMGNEERSGTVDAAGGRLLVSGVGGGEGPVARQLIRMPAGRFRLVAEEAPGGDRPSGVRIGVQLRCAASNAPVAGLALTAARGAQEFVSDGACGLTWLTINVVAPPGADGYDLALRRVGIERVGGRP